MALLPQTSAPGAYPATAPLLTFTTLSTTGDYFAAAGREVIVVKNTDATDPHTITIKSRADVQGRTRDIAQSVPASGMMLVGPFTKLPGWVTPAGTIEIDGGADAADLDVAIVALPIE